MPSTRRDRFSIGPEWKTDHSGREGADVHLVIGTVVNEPHDSAVRGERGFRDFPRVLPVKENRIQPVDPQSREVKRTQILKCLKDG